jgi:hypothetical protein
MVNLDITDHSHDQMRYLNVAVPINGTQGLEFKGSVGEIVAFN